MTEELTHVSPSQPVKRLLLAAESPTIRRVIEIACAGANIEVIAVGDGKQAIGRIATERPDVVLADIVMPRRTGYEVAAFIKADPALAHVPVLLMAGALEPVDEARRRKRNAPACWPSRSSRTLCWRASGNCLLRRLIRRSLRPRSCRRHTSIVMTVWKTIYPCRP